MNKNNVGKIVRKAYGKIAQKGGGCGCGCGPTDAKQFAKSIGYSESELKDIPAEANLGLSCGNPIVLAGLKKGETVLDLGSGAGFDCFIAAAKVGPKGKIIGVDMTPEMIEKARSNASKSNRKNVEFRLGEIENLPVADNIIDAVISNCVINLSADKTRVFREIRRVLKPGGRVAISDISLLKELPKKVKNSITAYVGCVSGALLINDYKKLLLEAGLKGVKITVKGSSDCIAPDTKDPLARIVLDNCGKSADSPALMRGDSINQYIVSVNVEGHK